MAGVYSVAQVNSYIKNMFAQDFLLRRLSVKGEVSNCKYHSSGHIYFTLKDGGGTLQAVMFASQRRGLNFKLAEGQQVVVKGTVDVYERDGKYQLYASEIELSGRGDLYLRFEKLLKELEEMGMFDPQYKRPIPRFAKTVGIVTAPTGAAIRDIMNITNRRNPYVQLVLYPALVQGENAAESIVKGIQMLERHRVDVIIVGRGGGSIEDLWAFNEEIVAQAVFDCQIPIISAVGHETDTTIIDYVADLRAPTPSAAAELAVCDISALFVRLDTIKRTMERQLRSKIHLYRERLQKWEARLAKDSPIGRIRERRAYLVALEDRLQNGMKEHLKERRHRLALYIEMLKGLSPLDKLNQGYSYVTDEKGNTVNDIQKVQVEDRLQIYVKNGKIHAKVFGKQERESIGSKT